MGDLRPEMMKNASVKVEPDVMMLLFLKDCTVFQKDSSLPSGYLNLEVFHHVGPDGHLTRIGEFSNSDNSPIPNLTW